MSTPVDPSWLPSTVAQSTAALVGIIGGLLVARFMSIDAEQSSLRARRAEAKERLDHTVGVRDDLESAALRRGAIGALSRRKTVATYFKSSNPEGLDVAAFLDDADINGWTVEEIAPFLDEAREVMRSCVPRLREAVASEGGEDQPWPALRRALGLDADDQWDDMREQTHILLKKRRLKQLESQCVRANPLGPLSLPQISSQMDDYLLDAMPTNSAAQSVRRTTAADEVRRAQFEFELADRALRGASLPTNLWAALWTLSGLAMVGLVLPVIALFALPSYDSDAWRWIVLIAFCAGITGLLIYLFVSASKLRLNAETVGNPTSVGGMAASQRSRLGTARASRADAPE